MTLYSLEQNVVERIAYFQKLCEGTVVWSLFQCSRALASREAQWLQGVAQARAAQRKRRTFARTRLTRTFAGAGCFALTPSQHARATSPHPALLGED